MGDLTSKYIERKQWIKKVYFLIGLVFSIVVLCAYLFAWSRGATWESILVSGSAVLIISILVLFFCYLLSINLAKRHFEKNLAIEQRTPWDIYTLIFLFAMVACDVLGVVMILVKKMFVAGAIVIIIGSIAFYFSSRRKIFTIDGGGKGETEE